MMNLKHLAMAEEMARLILTMPPELQDKAYHEILPAAGATPEEIEWLMKYVGLYRLHTDTRFRKAAQNALCEVLYKEFRSNWKQLPPAH